MTAHPATDPVTTSHHFVRATAPQAGHPGTFHSNVDVRNLAVDTGTVWVAPTGPSGPDPYDHGCVAWTGPPQDATTGSTPGAGILILNKVKVGAPSTATGLAFAVTTTGSTATAGQSFAALYSAPGDGTGSLLASVGIDTAVTAANDPVSVTFTAAVDVQPGFYYLGVLWNAGTVPTMVRSTAEGLSTGGLSRELLTFGQALTGAPDVVAYDSSLTALPATLDLVNDGSITDGSTRRHWMALVGTPAD